ncbi:RNase H domain-containing protein [Trichonephila clavipes]|nr:RNase H domain-containing protein [Trichonephila clavipes]
MPLRRIRATATVLKRSYHWIERGSDESRFQLCPDDHRKLVWRLPGQRADPAFPIACHTDPQPGVMGMLMAWSDNWSKIGKKYRSYITPIDYFNHVEFREELLASTLKHSSHPELHRQLSLEVINDTPDQTLIIYTDGCRMDTGRAGNGIFSNTPANDAKIRIMSSDYCSVFRSELIDISGALDHAFYSNKN